MSFISLAAPWRMAVVATLLAASATACGKKDADDSATLPPAGSTVGTSPSTSGVSTVAVTDVRLGKTIDASNRVTTDTDDFDPKDTIYASVVTTGASQHAMLHAHWTFEGGQLVDSTTRMIAPTGDAATEFHISKPDGFPKGKYKLAVLLDGAEVRTKEFKVD